MAGLSCEGEVDEAAEIVVFERLDRPMSEVHVQAVARTVPSLNDHPNYGNNSQYRRTANYEGLSWTILGVSTDASKCRVERERSVAPRSGPLYAS